MAYGLKYSIPFLNRENISCEVGLSLDGYGGASTTLEGGEKPFTLSAQAQDNNIPLGIRATESVIEFYSGGVSLTDFYSEVDTDWKVEFYKSAVLEWTGLLQLDNCSERITDTEHIISLNANDGLGRLQNEYLLDSDGTPLYRHWLLSELFAFLFSKIGVSLDVYAYLNIFENSTLDRDDFNYLTFLPQTAIDTKYYINDDNTTQSLYDILNSILKDFRACLFQASGHWNIVRWSDLRLFADGAIPGTKYNAGFSTYEEVFYPNQISIGKGLPVHPINENQLSLILRPYQYSKETFNYQQPAFINQYSLQIPAGATPFNTSTVGDLRYDDYAISTYFTFWKHIDGDTSYLQVVTNTTTETEVERYIVTPGSHTQLGLQFNAIPVSMNDTFDFSLSFRTPTDISDNYTFRIRFLLITADGNYWLLTIFPAGGSSINVHWNFIGSDSGWDDFPGDPKTTLGSTDTSQYTPWLLSSFVESGGKLPLIPGDGMLLIDIEGNNDTNLSQPATTTFWKDINLIFTQYINQSQQIIGQFHNNSQTPLIKNNEQFDVLHDDSPRNTITGTLFTDESTSFGAGIGGVYFTKTSLWHRQGVSETRKLGDLNTNGDLFIQRITREIIEGDFYGLTNVWLGAIIQFPSIPLKKFIIGIGSFDYMNCIWNAVIYELFDAAEVDGDLTATYLFNYIYNNQ